MGFNSAFKGLKTASRIEYELATNQEIRDFMFPSPCKWKHLLLWDVTQQRLVVSGVLRKPSGPVFRGQARPLCCPETSVTNYQCTLRNIPKCEFSIS